MRIEYKFLRTRAGITSFAVVGVVSSSSNHWSIFWNDSLADLKKVFCEAVEEGVMLAVREHTKKGSPQRIEVISLLHTSVDTRSDAVTVAAAVATWKSLGHLDSTICIKFQDGRWRVFFECVSR